MADDLELATLDCQGLTHSEICDTLRSADSESRLRLINVAEGAHGFAAGAESAASVETAASLGDFAGLLGQLTSFESDGSVGNSLAHSLVSGRFLVRGSAGDHVGAFASGGLVVVLGQAGFRCGYSLQGGEVFVRGFVGNEAACCMKDGDLVLGNGAGDNVGVGMSGGTVYVRGEIKSLSQDVRLVRMKDADSMRLSLLLARAGIKGNVKEFKAYRPKPKKH